jgi:restriction system protein
LVAPFRVGVALIDALSRICWAIVREVVRFIISQMQQAQRQAEARRLLALREAREREDEERRRRELLEEERRARILELADVDSMTGSQFENYVVGLLRYRGCQAKHTGGSGDQGCDILVEWQGTRYALQCKRYAKDLSRDAVKDAVGARLYHNTDAAMVVTNRYFTKKAIEYAERTGCWLVDRNLLAKWIDEYQRAGPT